MTLSEAMKEVESYMFAANLLVASDLTTFLREAKKQESVAFLLKESNSRESLKQIALKIFLLSKEDVDLRYANPWDTALTIYLWIVSLKDAKIAMLMTKFVAEAPQCWWATELAHKIVEQKID